MVNRKTKSERDEQEHMNMNKKEHEDMDLLSVCIEAACESKESVEKWRRQRRSLHRLPSPLADALLRRLLSRRLLSPSLLEYANPTFSFICVCFSNSLSLFSSTDLIDKDIYFFVLCFLVDFNWCK